MGAQVLQGRVVIVTGAASGIGRAHARLIAEYGAHVVVNDIAGAQEFADRLVSEGHRASADESDISTWLGARTLVESTVRRFGQLDGLVNNAGVLRRADVADLQEEDLDLELAVNLKGTFACTHFASKYWRSQARAGRRRNAAVVNTASDTIFTGSPGGTGYAATKAAIVALTQSASLEGEQYGVRHNAIAPSGRTAMASGSGLLDFNGHSVAHPEDQDPNAPDNPSHNSPLVVWLLSADADHVNGQVFRLRHGAFARMSRATHDAWCSPRSGAPAFEPSHIGRLLNVSDPELRFPLPMRDFPDRVSEPFSRLDHS